MEGTIIIIITVIALISLPFLMSSDFFSPDFINLEYFFNQILNVIKGIIAFLTGAGFIFWVKTILSLLAIFFITVFIYSKIRITEIRKEEAEKLRKIIIKEPEETRKNEKWESVLSHANSMSPSDWRLAIIEADTILDEMLKKMGYQGENLGERLKSVEPADFNTLDSAWEAHKVRNRIAHEGSDFKLTREDANKVIGMYEQVFREFEYI